MRQNKKIYLTNFIKYSGPVLVGIIFIIMFVVSILLNNSYNSNLDSRLTTFEDNWIVSIQDKEDEEAIFPFRLDSKIKSCTMTNTLGKVNDEDVLILQYQYQDITVKVNGTIIYEYEKPRIGNISTILGTNILSIPMKDEYSNQTIVLEMDSIKPTEAISIEHMYLNNTGDYLFHIFQQNILQLLIATLLLVTGIIYLIIYITVKVKKVIIPKVEGEYFLYLFIFSIFTGLWIITDLHILFLITGKLIVNDILSYLSFAIIPIGFVYINYYILKRFHKIFIAMEVVYILNLFIQMLLFVTGIYDFANMLIFSQILMFAGAIALFVMVLVAAIQGLNRERLILLIGFCIFSLFVMICLIGYVFGPVDFNYNTYFLLGMLVIAIVFGYIVLKEFIMVMGENALMEQTKKYAYTDALTGIGNRRAYEETLVQEKAKIGERHLTIIGFDVNFLKQANDTLGHKAGDELLIATAHFISKIFGNEEKKNVFRTGGDEFSAIVNLPKEEIEMRLITLSYEVKNWRGEINHSLSIAVGYAVKDEYPDISLEELSIKADEEMYKSKRSSHKIEKKNS